MTTDATQQEQDKVRSREIFTLIYAVFAAGLCSIVYELLIATTVSYFEGDSVKYFSLTIGLYMASMGLGAFVSKYVKGNILAILIGAEILLGALGAFSIPMLYASFSYTDSFLIVYAALTLIIGFLIGLEIPFLTRILEQYETLRVSIAHVLSLDYLGALIATIAFPFVLLPFFGIFQSSLFFGLLNMTIGVFLLWSFPSKIGTIASRLFKGLTAAIVIVIISAIGFSDFLVAAWNTSVYDGRILHSERTRYQQIVLTKYRDDMRMFLDGNIQFSSIDEYRYHEALVHVPLSFVGDVKTGGLKVLLLGAGDGLAVRELLKDDRVGAITLVDLDPAIVKLASDNPYLSALNEHSLTRDDRVRIVTGDAISFLKQRRELYDLILADLPDPNNTELSRLYTREVYRLIRSGLSPDGIFATQATSPLYAGKAFWSIHASIAAEFPNALPYHALVPSFGDWGFVVASARPLDIAAARLPDGVAMRYLDQAILAKLFVFEKDLLEPDVEASFMDRPQVLRYYLEGWRHWGR